MNWQQYIHITPGVRSGKPPSRASFMIDCSKV
jgi:hypothetical protein